MLHRIKPLAQSILALLATGVASSHAGSSFVAERATHVVPPHWNQPIAFTLEARSVEKDGAFGLHLVRPVFHTRRAAVLVEAYGFKGEGDLGLVGGGLVYRRKVGTRSAFETSAFFEGIRSTDGFAYPQLGVGVAFSPDRWVTLRANGYLPLRGKDSRRNGTERWTETTGSGAERREVSFSRELRNERAPMRGFDVEAELRLPEPPSWVEPRLAVGYSYRESEDRPEVYAGLTARAELHFAKHWVAEVEWRDDAGGIDQEWRAGVRFQMLFGGAPESEEVSDGGKTNDGKSHRATESSKGVVPPSAEADARDAELFLPVQRFPWPTVARGSTRGQTERGGSRSLAPSAVDDCCNSGEDPLIFD